RTICHAVPENEFMSDEPLMLTTSSQYHTKPDTSAATSAPNASRSNCRLRPRKSSMSDELVKPSAMIWNVRVPVTRIDAAICAPRATINNAVGSSFSSTESLTSNPKLEASLRHMCINRDHAPNDFVSSSLKRRQRNSHRRLIRVTHMYIAFVHLFPRLI